MDKQGGKSIFSLGQRSSLGRSKKNPVLSALRDRKAARPAIKGDEEQMSHSKRSLFFCSSK
jgi:hypothetical protein